MVRRIKRPVIQEDKRRNWLQRFESGESPSDIAQHDSFDRRTVKSQLQKAAADRDMKEVRQQVIRKALEEHYRDLISLTETIAGMVNGNMFITLDEKQEMLLDGLREHLPRSIIFSYLHKWESILKEIAQAREMVTAKLNRIERLFPNITKVNEKEMQNFFPGIKKVLAYQVECWVKGTEALSIERDYKCSREKNGMVDIYYGPEHFSVIPRESADRLYDVIPGIETQVKQWNEVTNLKMLTDKQDTLREQFLLELWTIELKKIVPGRCQLCPL